MSADFCRPFTNIEEGERVLKTMINPLAENMRSGFQRRLQVILNLPILPSLTLLQMQDLFDELEEHGISYKPTNGPSIMDALE